MQIEISGIVCRYGSTPAVSGVDLTIADGEFVALLGPSGSGKTTLLRAMAGLETPEAGSLRFGNVDALALPPNQRGVGFVFQHYALFKHMNVAENIAFGLTIRPRATRPDKAEIAARVAELLDLVHLPGLGKRYPQQLSGGQRQRVALARALAIEPRILLLDEPFGALDTKVRTELRLWLKSLHRRLGVTSVFVTHDQEEAMELADRIVVMRAGKIEQVGTPAEVYRQPVNRFVAGFLGSPRMNFLPAQAGRDDAGAGVQVPGAGRLALPADCAAALGNVHQIGVRPEHWQLSAPEGEGGLAASVERVEWLGDVTLVHCKLAGREAANLDADTISVKTTSVGDASLRNGAAVRLHAQPRDLMLFDAQGRALAA